MPLRPTRQRGSSLRARVEAALARAAAWKDVLAVGGAALLVLGYFRRTSWESAWTFATSFGEGIWAIWSPLEAFGAALLVTGAALASRRGRLGREAAGGVLLGVASITVVAMIAFVGSSFEFADTAVLTALGAFAILAGALLGLLARPPAREPTLPRRSTMLAAGGVALGLAPLVVDLANWESTLLDGWGWPFYVEVLLGGFAAALALLCLIRLPRARLYASGALVGIGTLLTLHLAGILVELGKDDGVRNLRYGGALGIAGGVLLIAAGTRVIRAGRPAESPAAPAVVAS